MKVKHLSLAMAVLLAASGLWFARSAGRTHTLQKPSMDLGLQKPSGQPKPDQKLRPPIPNRLFDDFTPEQRVQFARQGRGPGG